MNYYFTAFEHALEYSLFFLSFIQKMSQTIENFELGMRFKFQVHLLVLDRSGSNFVS